MPYIGKFLPKNNLLFPAGILLSWKSLMKHRQYDAWKRPVFLTGGKLILTKYSWWFHKLGQLVALAGIQISCGCRLTITFFIKSTRRLGWYNLIGFIKYWVLGDQLLLWETKFSCFILPYTEVSVNESPLFRFSSFWDWPRVLVTVLVILHSL